MTKLKPVLFKLDDKSKLVRTLLNTKEDYTALARCLNSFKDADSWPDGFGGNFIFTPEVMKDWYSKHDLSSYFVVLSPDDKTKFAGTCFVAPSWNLQGSYYVDLLGVDPSHQKQKLGKALLLQATKFATERNHQQLGLDTWAGNTNAMPLYKRQGYKWRVNTSVYMENYIPQILNHPFLRKMFTKFYWYDSYKPVIDQESNLEWYDYVFKFPDNSSLQVWVDKIAGMINGFHFKTNDEDLLVELSIDKSEAFIGIEEFPVQLHIKNQGHQQLEYIIDFTSSSDIEIVENIHEKLIIKPGEEKNLLIHAKFPLTTLPLDLKTEPEIYSNYMITINLTAEDCEFPLTIGKIPIKPLTINPSPINFITTSGKSTQLPLELKNNTGSDLPIHLILSNGKYTTLESNEFDLDVSSMDSSLNIPIQIEKTRSGVDTLRLQVSNKEGIEFINQEISIGILHDDKAIFFHQGPNMYLENSYLSIFMREKCQPGANYLEVNYKHQKLFMSGSSLNLGLPFQEWGSEFYKIDLEHDVKEDEFGIWLYSSALSKNKPGIKLTRKLYLSNTRPIYGVSYLVENINKMPVEKVAVKELISDWAVITPCKSWILPFSSGTCRSNTWEFNADLGNKPIDQKEGWRITEFHSGNIGVIFNLSDPNLTAVSTGNLFPTIDFEVSHLEGGSSFESSTIYYYFGVSPTEIRKEWKEKYGSAEKTLEPIDILPMQQIGIQTDTGKIAHGLIVDTKSKVQIGIHSDQKSTYKGNVELETEEEKGNYDIQQTDPTSWNVEINFVPKNEITSGILTVDTNTRLYKIPVAIGTYDSAKEIVSSVSSVEERNVFHLDNGYLEFKACDSFRGVAYYLGLTGKENLLHTFFPEIKPYLWFNRYYGGIKHVITPMRQYSEVEYSKLKFTGTEKIRGLWKGVEFTSPIINFEPTIKGLQTSVEYLTLPQSPFLLVQQNITNHSGIKRKFHTEISANMNISHTHEDQYWVPSSTSFDGIAQYHTQEYQPHSDGQTEWHAKWSAFQAKSSKLIIGMVSTPTRFTDKVYTYCPNKKYITLNRKASFVELKPYESFNYKTLIIVAKKLREIHPFSQTNLEDLLPK